MYILSVDTSAVSAGAALLKDGKIICETYVNIDFTHSLTTASLIDYVLKLSGLALDNIDYLAVSAGPGSFTGIRIGVATVKGLCFTNKKKCFAVSTLEALAHSADIDDCVICPVMDARRMQVYTALFEKVNGDIVRISDDAPKSLEELSNELKKLKKKVILIGDGCDAAYEFLSCNNIDVRKFSEVFKFQHASGVAIAAFRNYNRGVKPVDAEFLRPFYLRLPQAERKFCNRER